MTDVSFKFRRSGLWPDNIPRRLPIDPAAFQFTARTEKIVNQPSSGRGWLRLVPNLGRSEEALVAVNIPVVAKTPTESSNFASGLPRTSPTASHPANRAANTNALRNEVCEPCSPYSSRVAHP